MYRLLEEIEYELWKVCTRTWKKDGYSIISLREGGGRRGIMDMRINIFSLVWSVFAFN
jgi:hypothetical protein